MTWIELHTTLPRHRKTMALARELGISRVQAVGHLTFLWLWAIDCASDGRLPDSPQDVRELSGWYGDGRSFVDALITTGWLDRIDENTLEFHDWEDYAGKISERRQKESERKRRERAAKKSAEASAGHPQDVTRTSRATVPNRTVPNQTIDNTPQTPKGANDELALQDDESAKKRKPAAYSEAFDAFWNAHPAKDGDKKRAYKHWQSLLKAGLTAELLTLAHGRYLNEWRETGANMRFLKQLDNFLSMNAEGSGYYARYLTRDEYAAGGFVAGAARTHVSTHGRSRRGGSLFESDPTFVLEGEGGEFQPDF